MPTPIFVLGTHRSGTTWLANLLCEHPLIAGVRHEQHHGIHESAYFSRILGRYGDLSVLVNYIEFVEVMAASDYFRLAGIERAELLALWPTTYEAVFRIVMDRFAEREHAAFWLEKTPAHTLIAQRLARTYPDARFIAIRRDCADTTASAMGLAARRTPDGALARRNRFRLLLGNALGWGTYNRLIDAFAASCPRVLAVRYETLRADTHSALDRICRFLGIPFDPAMAESAYPPNSSFRSADERTRALSPTERAIVQAAAGLPQLLPVPALQALAEWKRVRSRNRPLPGWFFSLLDSSADAGSPTDATAGRHDPCPVGRGSHA